MCVWQRGSTYGSPLIDFLIHYFDKLFSQLWLMRKDPGVNHHGQPDSAWQPCDDTQHFDLPGRQMVAEHHQHHDNNNKSADYDKSEQNVGSQRHLQHLNSSEEPGQSIAGWLAEKLAESGEKSMAMNKACALTHGVVLTLSGNTAIIANKSCQKLY